MSGEARSHRTAAPPLVGSSIPVQLGSLALVQALAISSMLIDHLGALSILGDWSRHVGRLALPCFVVMVAANAWRCPDPGRLVRRLVVLLLVSQPLWWLSVGIAGYLCIIVTLLAVALVVMFVRRRQWDLAALSLLAFLLLSPLVEYGAWPLLLVPLGIFGPLGALPALFWPLVQYGQWLYAFPALVSVVVLVALVYVDIQLPRFPRWLTRWFYPGHLLVLSVVKLV